MTISKVLNSCSNCCNYTPKENPIKNAIHTWYLSNGGETHLIRHDDKIEFLTIQGEEKTSDVISLVNIPEEFSSPEDLIECMIALDPIFDADGKLERTWTENLHTWKVKYGNPVDLVCAVNQLYLKIMSDKETVLRKISSLDGSSLEEQVSWLKERQPHIYGRGGTCFVQFNDKIQERQSAIDAQIQIDMDHWSVTMFNSDTSGIEDACLPGRWMGHALLVVETIEEGEYFARQVDLVADQKGVANVRFFEINQGRVEEYLKDYSKSEIHRKPKQDIQRMINRIRKDICNQKKGEPNIFFKIDSGNMENTFRELSRLPIYSKSGLYHIWKRNKEREKNPLQESGRTFYNCSEYSLRNLSVANISSEIRAGCVLSKTFFPTPVLYSGSRIKAIAQEIGLIALYAARTGLPGYLIDLAGVFFGGPLSPFYFGRGVVTLALTDVVRTYLLNLSDRYSTGDQLKSFMDALAKMYDPRSLYEDLRPLLTEDQIESLIASQWSSFYENLRPLLTEDQLESFADHRQISLYEDLRQSLTEDQIESFMASRWSSLYEDLRPLLTEDQMKSLIDKMNNQSSSYEDLRMFLTKDEIKSLMTSRWSSLYEDLRTILTKDEMKSFMARQTSSFYENLRMLLTEDQLESLIDIIDDQSFSYEDLRMFLTKDEMKSLMASRWSSLYEDLRPLLTEDQLESFAASRWSSLYEDLRPLLTEDQLESFAANRQSFSYEDLRPLLTEDQLESLMDSRWSSFYENLRPLLTEDQLGSFMDSRWSSFYEDLRPLLTEDQIESFGANRQISLYENLRPFLTEDQLETFMARRWSSFYQDLRPLLTEDQMKSLKASRWSSLFEDLRPLLTEDQMKSLIDTIDDQRLL